MIRAFSMRATFGRAGLLCVLTLVLVLVLAACGNDATKPSAEPEAPPSPTPAQAPLTSATSDHAHAHAEGSEGAAGPALPTLSAQARVFFIAPQNAATVEGPLENGRVSVKVQMGAQNVAIEPAGEIKDGSGHHHVLIDVEPMPAGTVVPKDETHLHFGKGETEATLQLAPGAHKLTLQLADGIHRSYGEAMSASLELTVVAAGSVGATQ